MADEYTGPYQIPKITADDPVQRVRFFDALAVAINNGLGTVAGAATTQINAVAESVTALGPGYAKLSNLPDGTDLDTFNVAGLHRISSTNVGTMLNLPDGMAVAAILENMVTGTPGQVTWWTQRLDEYGDGARQWRRSSNDVTGGWGPWVRVSEQARKVTEWHVFLAAGQSNMVGRAVVGQSDGNRYVNPRVAQFGYTNRTLETATVPLDMHATATGLSPATTFANNYLRTQPPHVGVLLVPAAHGDTGFTNSTSTYTWTPGVATNPSYALPESAVTQTQDGIAAARATGAIVDFKGILWHQGEYNSSTTSASYTASLDSLIAWFRAQFAAPTLPFLVGQMVPEGIAASVSNRAGIDLVHQQTPGRVLYTGFAPASTGAYNTGDTTHMSQAGVEYLGHTYLEALGRALANTGTATSVAKSYTDAETGKDRSRLTAVEGSLNEQSERLDGKTLPADADFHAVTEAGVYRLLALPVNWQAQNMPLNVRGSLTVETLSTSRVLTYKTWELVPRVFVQTSSGSTWNPWREIGATTYFGLAGTDDLDTLTTPGTYTIAAYPVDWQAQHYPANVRGAFRIIPWLPSGSFLMEAVTEDGRHFIRRSTNQVWSPTWKEIGAATPAPVAPPAPPVDGPGSGLKLVPLALTVGNSESNSAATGTARMPMKWNAPLLRARVHIRNINPRGGVVRPGAVAFTGLWFGRHNTASEGTYSTAPKQISGAFSTPADGGEWVSRWFSLNNTPGVEDLLSFGYTATGVNVAGTMGTTWTNADPGVAGATAPTMGRGPTPFHVWVEAETYAATPVIASIGDSLSVGVGSTKPLQDSWLSQHCIDKGSLPVHYGSSGDSMSMWQDTSAYKWSMYAGTAQPDALIWALGSNDLFGGATSAETQARFNAIIESAKAKFSPNLYLTNVMPRTSVTGAMETERRAYNVWLGGRPGGAREMFDIAGQISTDDETIIASDDADGIHLTTAGYGKVTDAFVTPVTSPPVMYAA